MEEEILFEEIPLTETIEITQDISFDEINNLMIQQLNNNIEFHKINIIIFGVLLSTICIISFFKAVFNNA